MEKNISENDNEEVKNNDAETKSLSIKEIVTEELERLGSGGAWVWTLFFLCYTPNVLNGFHVSSYVFIGHVPNEIWCGVNALRDANWTNEQIRNITENGLTTHGCTIWNWDYDELSEMTYEDALDYTKTYDQPDEVKCTSRNDTYYDYSERDTSIVPEWDLVCDKAVWRTSAQLLVSIGKFAGATTFGLISDKYGRKRSFIIAGSLFIIGSIITTISPWFELFLAGRMALGLASSGMVYPAFALLSENISVKYRSLMSIAFGANYPIGMLILALAAYLTHPWRYLLLVLTIPSLLILVVFMLMKESPRWLLMKNREADAYRIVFKKKPDIEIKNSCETEAKNEDELTFGQKFRNSFKELNALFGQSTMRRMALTCYFMWCVTSLCYYVTALNADNLSANRYIYVAITGCVDIVSYIFPMILLKFMGRKTASFGLYTMAGISLLVVLAIPQDSTNWLVFFAMFGRFGISGVYSIVTLYTAELFPTEIRSFALGTSSTMAHVGSMIAPYIVDILGLFGWFIPTTICGCSIIAAGLLVLTLPETGTRSLKDTVKDDVEDKQET